MTARTVNQKLDPKAYGLKEKAAPDDIVGLVVGDGTVLPVADAMQFVRGEHVGDMDWQPKGGQRQKFHAGSGVAAGDTSDLKPAKLTPAVEVGLKAIDVPAGQGVFLYGEALATWDAGDGSRPFRGFAFGHVYDEPGVYAITRDGKPITARRVLPRDATRDVSLAKGVTSAPIAAAVGGVVRGLGPASTIECRGNDDGVNATAGNVTVRDLTIRQVGDRRGWGMGVRPGDGTAILDVDLGPDDCGVAVMAPIVGLLVERVRTAGMIAYGVSTWERTTGLVIRDCHFGESRLEHASRLSGSGEGRGLRFATILDATFEEADKGAMHVQVGEHVYVAGCRSIGSTTIGPLGEGDGLDYPDARCRHVVLEDNEHARGLRITHGAEHVRVTGDRVAGRVTVEGPDDRSRVVVRDGREVKQSYGGRTTVDVRLSDVTAGQLFVGDRNGGLAVRGGRYGAGDDYPIRMFKGSDAAFHGVSVVPLVRGGRQIVARIEDEERDVYAGDLPGVSVAM